MDEIPINNQQAIIVTYQPTAALLFDFPKSFELFNELASRYPRQELEHPEQLPPEGRALMQEAFATPWWQGLYGEVVAYFNPSHNYNRVSGPLFVKIGQGEVWRIFSPALLHLEIIHLLFNMIWLWVLGTQVEGRIGWWRYILVLLIASGVTNVCQYLASGPLFMGMSGVVTTLFGFIWMRQRRAPWEGYQLHRVTVAFIVAFIAAMLIFQLVSFGFEVAGRESIGPPIANTAHIVGLFLGAFLGSFDLFSYHEVRVR